VDLFSYQKFTVDARTSSEQFASRAVSPADAAPACAAFHVAMGRSAEPRTLIDEARKADPDNAAACLAEALMLDRDGKRAEARAAFEHAVDLGTTSAYAHHRAAVLNWRDGAEPDQSTLVKMEKNLSRAVALNSSAAASYAALAEVRAALRKPAGDIIPLLEKSIAIDPSDPWHRLTAARVLWRLGNLDQARKVGEVALRLAGDDEDARNEAQHLLSSMPK
jgi:cellulose synthase operon protein C